MFYSQFGEDKILFEIFHRKPQGLCIEVGANDGVNDSTSFFFEKMGWDCILVEPNPELCQEIRKVRSALLCECAASAENGITILNVAEGAERAHGVSTISIDQDVLNRIKNYGFICRPVEVKTRKLDEILMEAHIQTNIDFITIDVEGHELAVLKGFSIEKWKPTIILVEDNSNYENNAVSSYLKKHGYLRFMRTGVNDWYSSSTNRELVNFGSRMRYNWNAFKTLTKNKLRKIPGIAKTRSLLKQIGVL